MSSDKEKAQEKPATKESEEKKVPAADPKTPKPAPKPAEESEEKKVPAADPKTPKPAPKPVVKTDEPELPAFEKGISEKVVEKFGDKINVKFVKKDRVGIAASREDVHDVAEFVRDTLGYDHVESVSGVDYPQDKEIEVVYHIGSYTDPLLASQILVLSTRAQREEIPIPGNDATKLPSLRDVFYSVEFHEREVFEMLGVYFEGHPDNRRLLLPEDWADLPPLRKDFAIKGR
ncbi:MAG: NADH-quinone oxidoreductase subunit C [Nitrosopumilus sp. B06]|nr:MAG: NADH-quinone oxidoreductase subunit C [Nitrosopumilus sp. B06]